MGVSGSISTLSEARRNVTEPFVALKAMVSYSNLKGISKDQVTFGGESRSF